MSTTIVWLDEDLRLSDHPALHAAAREAEAVVPVYLEERLSERGCPLVLRAGEDPAEALLVLARAVGADRVRWNRRYEPGASATSFLRQLGWREFAYHVLVHHPETRQQPLKDRFRSFPWQNGTDHLKAWQRGCTGYPVVDAAMHQLWRTGWMHNRARMIVASFLTNDLLQPWQAGETWFWDTLVDADPPNNVLGWQWAAGCGADAQPFFRIFHPLTQSRKFDPEGRYIARYLPELEPLAPEDRHAPWTDAPAALTDLDYPEPIVDHDRARDRALEAYEAVR